MQNFVNKNKYGNKKIIGIFEKMFISLDDDFLNLSWFLFNFSVDCDRELLKMNAYLDESNQNIKLILNNY